MHDGLSLIAMVSVSIGVAIGVWWLSGRQEAQRRELAEERARAEGATRMRIEMLESELKSAREGLQSARTEIAALQSAPKPETRAFEVIRDTSPKCLNCKHFDIEEGQAAMRNHPQFAEVMRHVSPARMANRMRYDKETGKPLDEQPDDVLPQRARWKDFGACDVHNEVRYGGDTCDRFEPKLEVA